jgi:hypothetical protein
MLFQLVLRLVGTEMHQPITYPTQTWVVFSACCSMGSSDFRVVQCGKKDEHHTAVSCHVFIHGRILPDWTLQG